MTGYTYSYSTGFPTTPGAYDRFLSGFVDVFVAKLNPTGTGLVYSTYLGGSGGDGGYGIAVDSSGNAYVAGYTDSTNFPTTSGAFDTVYNGGSYDVFVTKLNPTGSALVYSTFLGGSGGDYGYGIAVGASGNAYVTGTTTSTNFPTTSGAFDTSHNGGYDAFATKLNSAGSALLYSTYMGGSGGDYGYGIAVDSSGNAYVTGRTGSTNFPTTSGAFDTTSNGSSDAFVTTLNPTGTGLVYSTYMGGSGGDYGYGIAVDSSGNAYVAGETDSTNFPTTSGAFDTTSNGSSDAFVTTLNPTGTGLVYSTYMGGNGWDGGRGIAVRLGNAYVTGTTQSTNFPTTSGAFDTIHSAGYDAFVTRFSICTYSISPAVMSFGPGGGTDSVSVTATSGCSWNAASNDPSWLQITSGNNGTGNGTVNYSVSLNTSGSSRKGKMTIAGKTFTVIQYVPDISISPTSRDFGSVNVGNTSPPQHFIVTNMGVADLITGKLGITGADTSEFIIQNDKCSGKTIAASGTCTVGIVFSPSFKRRKSANLTIPSNDPDTPTLDVPLSGVGGSCGYSISPAGMSFGSGSGTDSVSVTATSGCSWNATSNDPSWLVITSGSNGSGNGTVNYSVSAYTGSSRTGTITIAGKTFTVTQDGGQIVPAPCPESISPVSKSFGSSGGTDSVTVAASGSCDWTATSSDPSWINITSGNNGTGDGTVDYSVSAYTGSSRTGTITIAGKTFTVTQDGGQIVPAPCPESISPVSKSFGSSGGTDSLTVDASGSCSWTATSSDPSWLEVTSGGSGTGGGIVNYSVSPNTGAGSRTDTITITGDTSKVFTVTQMGVGASPAPDIKANGSDVPITLGTSDILSVTVSLAAGGGMDVECDWWVVVATPFGWYYFDAGTRSWAYAGGSYTDLSFTHQGPLFDLGTFTVLNRHLPAGTYTFYFAVDTNRNGVLDMGNELFFDSVVVTITP